MQICLVSRGFEERTKRLQPWQYLLQIAEALRREGHRVSLISNTQQELPQQDTLMGLSVTRVPMSWPNLGHGRTVFWDAVAEQQPDVVFWHVGLVSFLHLGKVKHLSVPVIGLFTAPPYYPSELLRLGLGRLARGWRLSVMHLLGLCVPRWLIRRALQKGVLKHLVVECETTRTRLVSRGVQSERVSVVHPGISGIWFEARTDARTSRQLRCELGFAPDDFVVGFFGPPTPLRGLPNLLHALAQARAKDSRIALLVLSRKRGGEHEAAERALTQLIDRLGAGVWTRLITGFLPPDQLVQMIASCDAVALPFELVPSDVPLSVLEAQALGVPVVATQVACLPEMVPDSAGICVPPANASALADALCSLARSESLRRSLADGGRQNVVARYSLSTTRIVWASLFEQVSRSL